MPWQLRWPLHAALAPPRLKDQIEEKEAHLKAFKEKAVSNKRQRTQH